MDFVLRTERNFVIDRGLMIITTIKIHGRPEKRREILLTLNGLTKQMIRDGNCVRTDLYQDLTNRDIFYFTRECRTKIDLEKYMTSKSLAVLLGLETLLEESLETKHAVRMSSCSDSGRDGE